MKIEINDSKGSELIAVLKLDGSPAQEGIDYVTWEGEYHKNGKWSYTEGGVALKEGIVIYQSRSTHYNFDCKKWAIIVKDNQIIYRCSIMGRFSETPERPKPWNNFPLEKEIWDKILEAIIKWGDPNLTKPMLEKWEKIEKFI
jgi:hypothetical protein